MDVKWLSDKPFVVKGTTYTIQIPITLEKALEEVQTMLSEIKKKKKYYKGLLEKLDFSDSFLNKAPVKIIVDKIKIEEDTYKMLFFLNEEEYKYTLYLKIVLKVLDFVNDAYQELDYKMKYKLIPQGQTKQPIQSFINIKGSQNIFKILEVVRISLSYNRS